MANMNNNSIIPKEKQEEGVFALYLTSQAVQDQIKSVLGGKSGQRFISAISSAVQVNSALKGCRNSTIVSGALLGESLQLSPSPQLGQYYLVPFNDKEKGKVAQFILGYKLTPSGHGAEALKSDLIGDLAMRLIAGRRRKNG